LAKESHSGARLDAEESDTCLAQIWQFHDMRPLLNFSLRHLYSLEEHQTYSLQVGLGMQGERSFMRVSNRDIVLHLLCLGVLLFAFQAKLAIYRSSADPVVAGSKLTIQKNSSRGLSAIDKREPTKAEYEFRLYTIKIHSLYRDPLHMSADHSARIDLLASSRLSDQAPSYSHRPPPILP
jgi:hypothetical protein